jgi:flagellar biosynthesis/type III secretory pathway protein FliH
MSAVIKSADVPAANVTPLHVAQRPHPRPAEPSTPPVELAVLRHEVEVLGQTLAQRDVELERLRGDVGRAYREGEAEGRKAGLLAAESRRAEDLKALEAGVSTALGDFSASLRSLERLAVAIAREGLAQVLQDPAAQAELATQVIRRQVARLEGEATLRVEVSAKTFTNDEALGDLARSFEGTAVDIVARAELDVGQARIRLGLGVLDIGVAQQWGRMSDLLTRMADHQDGHAHG